MRMLLLLLWAVSSTLATHHHHTTSDEISREIADTAAILFEVEEQAAKLQSQFDLEHRDMVHIKNSIDTLEGSGCDDRYQMQCGGEKPVCISRLLICDEVSDCGNSLDEEQCGVRTPVGSEWKGEFTYDVCTTRKPESLTMHIHKYEVPIELKSFPEIEAHVEMSGKDPEFSYTASFILDGVMDIKPGEHLMYFEPPETDGLALQCTFDGVNDDHCHGEILAQVTRHTCAEFFMYRVDKHCDSHHGKSG